MGLSDCGRWGAYGVMYDRFYGVRRRYKAIVRITGECGLHLLPCMEAWRQGDGKGHIRRIRHFLGHDHSNFVFGPNVRVQVEQHI